MCQWKKATHMFDGLLLKVIHSFGEGILFDPSKSGNILRKFINPGKRGSLKYLPDTSVDLLTSQQLSLADVSCGTI
jgi:hypothetical protein